MLWANIPGVSDLVFMKAHARIIPERNTGINIPTDAWLSAKSKDDPMEAPKRPVQCVRPWRTKPRKNVSSAIGAKTTTINASPIRLKPRGLSKLLDKSGGTSTSTPEVLTIVV